MSSSDDTSDNSSSYYSSSDDSINESSDEIQDNLDLQGETLNKYNINQRPKYNKII